MRRPDRVTLGGCLLILAAAGLGACAGEEGRSGGTSDEQAATDGAGDPRWPQSPGGNTLAPDAPSIVRDLFRGQLDTLARIGALEDPEAEVFGDVRDVALDATGRVLVLDAHYDVVRAFTRDGRFLFEFGGGGVGPGEFSAPESLAVGRDGRVYVSDRRTTRVSMFTPADTGYTFDRSFRVPVTPEDLCLQVDRLVVHGAFAKADGIFHVFTRDPARPAS